MIPTQGFFPRYVKYASELTDAPEVFHVAAALAVHSAVCSNYAEVCYSTKSHGKILHSWSPTHLWVFLVAPSGNGRKTTAINLASEVAGPIISGQKIAVDTSPASTWGLVARHPDAFLEYPEGGALISLLNAPYWASGRGLLTQMYDGKDMKRSLAGEATKKDPNPLPRTVFIKRPRITMLVGIAPSHLDRAKDAEFTGGFIGRTMIVFARRDRHDPTDVRRNEREMLELRGVLKDIRSRLEGLKLLYVGMKKDSETEYIKWSSRMDDRIAAKNPKVQSLYERLCQNVLRVAAHYALSQNFKHIDLGSIRAAIAYGEYVAKSTDLVGEMLSDDPVLRRAWKMRNFLSGHPKDVVSLADVQSGLGLSYGALKGAIECLRNTGEIRQFTSAKDSSIWFKKATPAAPRLRSIDGGKRG